MPEPIVEKLREPYNSKYCKAVDCSKRHGNKCTIEGCVHSLKRLIYFESTGEVSDGDVEIPERPLVEGK